MDYEKHLSPGTKSPGQTQLVAAPFANTDRSKSETWEAAMPARLGGLLKYYEREAA
jgi:hypothetical protein